jgi:uncharacterized membrane protein YhaH (DUF805 family)
VVRATAPGSAGVQVQTNGPLAAIFWLATILPLLAAGWRRMHDTGRSGLFLFYPVIAFVGITSFIGLIAGFQNAMRGDIGAVVGALGAAVAIPAVVVMLLSPLMVLWWLARPSQPGDNIHGPFPGV